MSVAVYKETKKDIDEAYCYKNTAKIEKETSFILYHLIAIMLSTFKDRVKGVSIEQLDFKETYIFTKKNQKELSNWLILLQKMAPPISDLEFGKLKVDLEYWYYEIGGKEINFEYRENYLIKPSQASKQLGISTVTLNKYFKQGFECVDTRNHHKIPKHAVEIWKDPVYAIKMQMLAQKRKLQKQSPAERVKEIDKELLEFQIKYKAKSHDDAFQGYDIDILDDPSEYYEWRDLVEEKEHLITQLIGDSHNGRK